VICANRSRNWFSWRPWLFILSMLPAALPPSIPGAEKPARPLEKIRIAYSSISGNTAPLWVTQDRGFFRKYGLDVELVFIAGGSTAAQALVSKDVAVAQVAGAGVLQSHLRGADLVLIGGLINTLTFQLIVNKEISQPDHLKGKSVGVTRYGSSTDFAMRYALDKWRLDPQKDVSIAELATMPNLLGALESGKIHGAMLSAPFTLRAKKTGFPVLANLQMLGLEYQHTGIATTQALIKSRPDLIGNVMRAYVEGIHYYKTNRKESLAILEKYLKTDDAEALTEVYEDIGLALIPEKPYPTLRGIQIMLRELAATDAKAKAARPEQFVDTSFVKELDSSGFIDRLYKSKAVVVRKEAVLPPPAPPSGITKTAPAGKALSTPAPADVPQEYTVKLGDTLSHLATRFYGSMDKWRTIYQANAKTVKNPDYIYVGQKLVIPAL
jgi:NitT/TauT family transport system substrate-binding protein